MHRQVELPASGGQGLDRTQRTVIHSNEAHRARRRPAERVTERRIDTQPLYRRAVFADGQPDMAALVDRDALVPAEPILRVGAREPFLVVLARDLAVVAHGAPAGHQPNSPHDHSDYDTDT